MSEDDLIKLIRKTVLQWAIEEYLFNKDAESELSLPERYEDNSNTFMQRLKAELEEDFGHIEGLPL